MLSAILVNQTAYAPMSATANPITVSDYFFTAAGTTTQVTVTPTGGDGTYTHSWSYDDNAGGIFTGFSNAASATTGFTVAVMALNTLYIATARDHITDGSGNSYDLVYTVAVYYGS